MTTLPRDTIKRLAKDVADIYKNPLNEHNIYYIHNDINMLKGYALIIGNKDTIYRHGFYLFEFSFPTNYPYSPPVVKFCTQYGNIRFHPNLYRNGKVCLSILNTWEGEAWTSCQSIRTVLLTLITIFDNKPLLHEPGITESNEDFKLYHEMIEYSNLSFSFLRVSDDDYILNVFDVFYSIIKKYSVKYLDDVLKIVKDKKKMNKNVKLRIYDMSGTINYTRLEEKINERLKVKELTQN